MAAGRQLTQVDPPPRRLFGEEEEIEGYDGLGIDIWLTPGFQALVDVKYASKADGATDLATPFRELFEAGFFTQKPDFDKALEEEAQLDLAELGEQVAEAATEEGSRFVVLHANLAAASSKLKVGGCLDGCLLSVFLLAAWQPGAQAQDEALPRWPPAWPRHASNHLDCLRQRCT